MDKTAWGCAETGVVVADGVKLSGATAAGFVISSLFSSTLNEYDKATITVIKDSANWSVHSGVMLNWVYPDWVLSATEATQIHSAGSIALSDQVTVLGLAPPVSPPVTDTFSLYVSTSGDDTHSGGVDDPLYTIQAALNLAVHRTAGASASVQINVADGTYSGDIVIPHGLGEVTIQGNTDGYPQNVIISGSVPILSWAASSPLALFGLTLSGAYVGLLATRGARTQLSQVRLAGTPSAAHLRANQNGIITSYDTITVATNAPCFFSASSGGMMELDGYCTVVMDGTRAFSTAFAALAERSLLAIRGDTSFSGSATGKRYDLSTNSVLVSGGKTLPGNTAGTTATGAQYT